MKETDVMSIRQFSLSAFREAARVIVRACGRLTLGYGADEAIWVAQLEAAGGSVVALDLSCVTDVDARGVGVLAALGRRALHQQIRLSVVGASRVTQRLARLTGLDGAIAGHWSEPSGAPGCLPGQC